MRDKREMGCDNSNREAKTADLLVWRMILDRNASRAPRLADERVQRWQMNGWLCMILDRNASRAPRLADERVQR